MSMDAIKQIVNRAASDLDFRQLLISDPEAALTGYDLTPEEKDLLRGNPADTFEALAMELGERVSRARVKVKFPWDQGDPPPPPPH